MRVGTIRLNGVETLARIDEKEGVAILPQDGHPALSDVYELILAGPERWAGIAKADGKRVPLDTVELLAPLPRPPRDLFAIGLNYRCHGEEAYAKAGKPFRAPSHPVVFTKDKGSVAAPFAPLDIDYELSTEIDWEVEIAVVLGKPAHRVTPTQAADCIFGYCVSNDITARDLQTKHKQYYLSKSLPGSCPIGPWIVTPDEIADPANLAIALTVNSVTKQSSSTAGLLFDIPTLISRISRIVPMQPGDIILTGTPAGVGFAREPAEYLAPGDVVECVIEGLGSIRNEIRDLSQSTRSAAAD